MPAEPEEVGEIVCGNHTVKKVLGSGSFGSVYLTDQDGKERVVKQIETDYSDMSPLREVDFLNRFNHPNVMSALETYLGSGEVCLVLPYMSMDFEKIMKEPKMLEGLNKHELFYEMVCGLSYLHTNWVVHQDIKPANILFDPDTGKPKIADFGLSVNLCPDRHGSLPYKTMTVPCTRVVVTSWWRSPELFVMEGLGRADENPTVDYYGPEIDIYSMGWVGMELLFDIPPPRFVSQVGPIEAALYLEMLGANPGDRYQSSLTPKIKEEFREALANQVKVVFDGIKNYFSFSGSSKDQLLFQVLEKAIKNTPENRPTAPEIKEVFSYHIGIKCEVSKIEYQAVPSLGNKIRDNECFKLYNSDFRREGIDFIIKLLEKAEYRIATGVAYQTFKIIEMEAIDIMDRIFSTFSLSGISNANPRFWLVACVDFAIGLYADGSWQVERSMLDENQRYGILSDYRETLPDLVRALGYKIYRPSLAHLGMNIEESLACYKASLVPAKIELKEGVCSIIGK